MVPTGIHAERTRGDPGLHAERTRMVPTGIHILGEHVVVARLAQGDLLVLGLVLGEDAERTKGVPGVHHVLEELHLVLLD